VEWEAGEVERAVRLHLLAQWQRQQIERRVEEEGGGGREGGREGEARSLARVKALDLLYHGSEGVKSFSAVGQERVREEGREEGVMKVLAEALLEKMEREA